ncbi:MAG TPA: DNA repair exonuclease [Thermoguttaceae bacterium]|nr:DNA repair exonuclease [Thermoguttaceae bacterium]
MKFLHTADWHIGMKAAHAPAAAQRLRDERLAAARRVVEVAAEHQVDFLLLAGDTFENNGINRTDVRRVALALAEFKGPVYLVPCNHDPLVPGSVWEHPCWTEHENLHVLRAAEPVAVPGGRLYPCPVFTKHATADPTAWIDARADAEIAVGAAHGSVEGVPQDQPESPIPRDAAARRGLDYLALGHWHSTVVSYDRMAYSGTHETTKFDERDSGNVLLVEIAARGAVPRITPIHTGGLSWLSLDEEIRDDGDLARVRQRIETIDDPSRALLNLSLRGMFHADQRTELSRIEEIAAARDFLFHRIDSTGLFPAPKDDGWLADLPVGPLRETARRLQRWSDPATTDQRPDGVTPQVATRALLDFYALWRGGQG